MANEARNPAPYKFRWTAVVAYQDHTGYDDDFHHVDEIEDLQSLIEGGPDFNDIEHILITYNFGDNNG